MVDDAPALAQRLQALLTEQVSTHRSGLNELVVDALLAQPTSRVLGEPELHSLIVAAFSEANATIAAERFVSPALTRMRAQVAQREETLRELLPDSAVPVIAELIARGEGPRFGWLRGAVDPALIRQLFAPVVQDTLVSFTQKLPIPGASGGGAQGGSRGGSSAGLGGLVGGFAKQMSKSAGQFAEIGKGVMGGLGAELERRMQAVAKDFSQTAMSGARDSVKARLASEEGKALIAKMREQALAHVLQVPLHKVVDDVMHLPVEDIAALAPSVVAHNQPLPLWSELLEAELRATLETVGARSLGDLLEEADLLSQTRALALRVMDEPARELLGSEAFGEWLAGLLDQA